METLESILDKDKIRKIAIGLSARKFFSFDAIENFLKDLSECEVGYEDFVSHLKLNAVKSFEDNDQFKLRRYIITQLEGFFGTPFDSLKEFINNVQIPQEAPIDSKQNLSYSEFQEAVIPPVSFEIKKISENFQRLGNKRPNLTAEERTEYVRNAHILETIAQYSHSDGDSPEKQTVDLMNVLVTEYGQRGIAKMKKMLSQGFAEYLKSVGLNIKLNNKGIDTSKLKKYLVEIKLEKQKEITSSIQQLSVDGSKLETMTYELVFDGKPKNGGKLLDAYGIGQEFLIDLLKFGDKFLITNRQKDALAIAKQMIVDKKFPGLDQTRAVLSKNKKIFIDELISSLKHNNLAGEEYSTKFNLFSRKGVDVRNIWNFIPGYMNPDLPISGIYLACRDSVIEDLLEGVGLLGKDYRKFYEDFTTFWSKFTPHEYDLKRLVDSRNITKKEESYYFALKRSSNILKAAVKEAGACLEKNNIIAYTQDLATFNIICYQDGSPKGYARLFLTTNKENEPGLAMDTIEIGHKDFQKNSDWVRATTLAASQLCLDTNLRFLIGADARIAYGGKQGFGNKALKMQLTKIGGSDFQLYDPKGCTGTYCIDFNDLGIHESTRDYLLMQNWRRNLNGIL